MIRLSQLTPVFAGATLMWHTAMADVSRESLEAQVSKLKRQNKVFKESLVSANMREQESAAALSKIRTRLEALGTHLLGSGEDRLVEAVSDLELLTRQLDTIETAAMQLSSTVQHYLKSAVVSDPDIRKEVEIKLRELDVALGLRHKPRPKVDYGTLQHARVVSIDSESGLLVLNVGEKMGARIGMIMTLKRGGHSIGEAVIAETRKDVCGVLIESLAQNDQSAKLGDLASIKTFH